MLKKTTMTRPKNKGTVREYAEAFIIAFVIALLIRTFLVQAFKIPSSSMEPTLLVGDHILVSKFIYGIRIPYVGTKFLTFHKPQRGDIVVFVYPEDPKKDFIKRVIATEGEAVQIKDRKIFIDGKVIEDPWGVYRERDGPLVPSYLRPRDNYGPKLVPSNSLFVMGDNRDNSQDSRYWGFVDLSAVKGKAFIIYFSYNKKAMDLLNKVRWGRFGKLLR